jgi:hypothetical protein
MFCPPPVIKACRQQGVMTSPRFSKESTKLKLDNLHSWRVNVTDGLSPFLPPDKTLLWCLALQPPIELYVVSLGLIDPTSHSILPARIASPRI